VQPLDDDDSDGDLRAPLDPFRRPPRTDARLGTAAGTARPDFDALVVAGDLIPRAERGVKWLAERVTDRPVIFVPGNHEAYSADVERTVEKAREAAAGTTVRVLQNETVGWATSPSRVARSGPTSNCTGIGCEPCGSPMRG
jgi:hypothetical protein